MSKPRYRQSQIKDYLRCGIYYEFRYIQGLTSPGNGATTVGSAVDFAVNSSLEQKIKTGSDFSLAEIVSATAQEFDRLAPQTDFKGEDPKEFKTTALQISKLYWENVSPSIQPETVQETFLIDTDSGYQLTGTFDVTDKKGQVRDLKTASPSRAREYDVNTKMQAAMYDWAYEQLRGKPSTGFVFDILTREAKPRYISISGQVTPENREFLFRTINNFHQAVSAGVALPAPEDVYWCSKKWCPFWDKCKGKKS